ncbi:MAG: ethanolamine utilization protein EutP [Anaerocolumna sp.]|jgi:ethanolamine utilization protein EutP|nr:ethanolamine utilization protein EutP [Anaerocolumna sp.]
MKKLILIGRSESGKTTLTQALKGEKLQYAKTQATDYMDMLIDTPGEYAQTKSLASALALYAYEADVVGLLLGATEDYSLFSPNITSLVNREVIGIVTQIDKLEANCVRAGEWLKLAGCHRIFYVSAVTGEGLTELRQYLMQ